MYALNLAEDGRILSVTFAQFAPADAVMVDTIPDGDVSDYLYQDGQFVHEPLPKEESEEHHTNEDRITELEARATEMEERATDMEEAMELLLSGVTE